MALEVDFNQVILEGDSQILINAFTTLSFWSYHEGYTICSLLFFLELKYSHVCRHCNTVAHLLAKRTISSPFLNVWMEDVPPDILDGLQVDLNSLP